MSTKTYKPRRNPEITSDLLRELEELKTDPQGLDIKNPRAELFFKKVAPFLNDTKLGEWFGVTNRTIKNWRKKLGVKRATAEDAGKPVHEMTKEDMIATEMVNSMQFDIIKEALTPEEQSFYVQEWAELSVQFEDVLATERRQIDQYIKSEIMANRILVDIAVANKKRNELGAEIDDLRMNSNMETDEKAQRLDDTLLRYTAIFGSVSRALTEDYQKLLKAQSDILSDLNAKRRDRIDVIKSGKIKFHDLVQQFRDKELRKKEGRQIELIKMSKQKKDVEFRKPIRFPDGQLDCIVLDSDTPTQQQDIMDVLSVLVIENDITRMQWFIDWIGKDNNIQFADEVGKAIKHLQSSYWDYVLLDYDIKFSNSVAVAQHISDNRTKVGKILIHSNNQEGVDKLISILPDAGVMSFKEMFGTKKKFLEVFNG